MSEPHASTTFTPDFNRDEFGLTTWMLSGRLRALDVVYAGGRLGRDVDAVVDYTHYNTGGGYITYYLCSGNLSDPADPNNCYDPVKQYTDFTTNDRDTHELRFATNPAKRWRPLGGLYLNDAKTTHLGDYHDSAVNAAHAEHISSVNKDNSGRGFLLGNVTLPTAGVISSGPRPPTVTFFNDYTRTEEEIAVFGEVAFDFTEQWSVAVSGRRYDLTSGLQGASNLSFGCRYGIGANARRTADGRCDGHDFSNDVTLRLRLLGQYAASGDDSLILNARSPNGEDGTPRDLFRGGGSNQATLDAIKSGKLGLAGVQPDGTINEVDTILKATLSWRNDDLLRFATYSEWRRTTGAPNCSSTISATSVPLPKYRVTCRTTRHCQIWLKCLFLGGTSSPPRPRRRCERPTLPLRYFRNEPRERNGGAGGRPLCARGNEAAPAQRRLAAVV